MIEYVEVRNQNLEIIGIIDTAISIIWHSVYYGVGDFEIYAKASQQHFDLLKRGYYITRIDNSEIGIIEKVNISRTAQDGEVITASGRFAKSILGRRQIYKLSGYTNTATVLSGNVESAVRALIANNAISCSWDTRRNIGILALGPNAGITKTIVDENGNPAQKQVSYENLLEYTEEILKEYGMASRVTLQDAATKKLLYSVYEGTNRGTSNTAGNEPIIFSVDFDNLISSDFTEDETTHKNAVLIGGAGEELERFYTLLAGQETGLQRKETWLDASSINKTYKDEYDVEQTYTDAEYRAMLVSQGKQELARLPVVSDFSGSINTTFGQWKLNDDYFIGDIVTIQDNRIGKYADVRITEITEVQDENGYSIEAIYE